LSQFSYGEETDKDDKLLPSAILSPRGLRTTGPAVTGVEELLPAEEEVGVAIGSAATLEHQTVHEHEAVRKFEVTSKHKTAPQHETNLSQHEVAPLITSVNQEEGVVPMDKQSGSLVIMIPSIEVLEQSLTTRLALNKPMVIDIQPSHISSPQSEEEVDYSGEDLDFEYDHLSPSKFSHLVIEDMEVTPSSKTISSSADTL